MTKKKIMFVIWSLELGGAERVVINLAKYINHERFEVFVCCLDDAGEFSSELEDLGIKVIALHKKRGIDFLLPKKISSLVRDYEIDILAPHLWGANLWTRIAILFNREVLVLVTEHNVDIWKRWWHRLADRLLQFKADRIIVVSEKVKTFYQEEIGIKKEKLAVIYNGVEINARETSQQKNNALRSRLQLSEGTRVIACIGRIVEAKRHDVFFDALRLLREKQKNFIAVVAGDGPLRNSLEKKYADLVRAGVLRFIGLEKDINKLLDVTDISVLTSTREGFSIVVLESMAKSIPFVATDVGGNSEQIINSETGFLVDVGDSQAIAEKINTLLADKEIYRSMSAASFSRVNNFFSVKIMASEFEKLIERSLKGKQNEKN